MAEEEGQPDWSNLPFDLLEPIGKRTRDAVTGLAAFRSVCRAWRAAVEPAPRLLIPRVESSEDALVFPMSRGWSIVVNARDASCRLSHLATGATAALPRLDLVRHSGSDTVTHLPYQHHCRDLHTAIRNWYKADLNYLLFFTDHFRFAVHVPPGAPAAGMTIMIYSILLALPPGTGMCFCHPGDAAWTLVKENMPFPLPFGFCDLAYHNGKMYGMDTSGEITVFDAATLRVLCTVERPPDAPNPAIKMYGIDTRLEEFNFLHLVALPSKLVLVRTSIKSSQPVAFDVFELSSTSNGLAWLKVKDTGNYELFLDGYHTTFTENSGANYGTRIYYVHDVATADYYDHKCRISPAAFSYNMQDNKLECVYRPPEDIHQRSTKPSWFIP